MEYRLCAVYQWCWILVLQFNQVLCCGPRAIYEKVLKSVLCVPKRLVIGVLMKHRHFCPDWPLKSVSTAGMWGRQLLQHNRYDMGGAISFFIKRESITSASAPLSLTTHIPDMSALPLPHAKIYTDIKRRDLKPIKHIPFIAPYSKVVILTNNRQIQLPILHQQAAATNLSNCVFAIHIC